MITDKRLFEHKRHHMFNHLRWWGVKMHEAYEDQNPRLIEYYEGVIWGTIDAMLVSEFISLTTYETLDNMLTAKRAKLREVYIMLICPNCKNKTLQTYKTNSLEAKGVGIILRYRKCTQCGCNYQTIEKIKEGNDGTEEKKE